MCMCTGCGGVEAVESLQECISLPIYPFRLLEVNGHNVTGATPEGVKSILQNTSRSVQLVVARQQAESESRAGSPGVPVAGQGQETKDSLQKELRAEGAEAQKWRELYEQ